MDKEEVKNETLEEKIERLEKINKYLQTKLDEFIRGDASLFHAVQKKKFEISELLNKNDLRDIDIMSKSDASFERIFKLLEKCESISNSSKALGEMLGTIKPKEERKSFVDSIAEERR
jgi:hypothetical protein